MTTKSSHVRYAFMILTTVLLIVALALNLTKSGDRALLCMHCVSILMSLIYLPATVYLSVKHRDNKFDRAGGEIAYIVVQMVTWLAGAIESISIAYWSVTCEDLSFFDKNDIDRHDYQAVIRKADAICASLAAVGALSLAQVLIYIAWLTLIVIKAHKVKGFSPNQAYLIPTHFLLEGTFNRDPRYWNSGKKEDMANDQLALDQYPRHGLPIERTMTDEGDDTKVSANGTASNEKNADRV